MVDLVKSEKCKTFWEPEAYLEPSQASIMLEKVLNTTLQTSRKKDIPFMYKLAMFLVDNATE